MSLNDLKRGWLLRQLGLSSSSGSAADLESALYNAGSGVVSNRSLGSGRYYRHSGITGGSSTSVPTLGNVSYVPFEVGKVTTFSAICIEVTTAGTLGNTLQMGIYTDDGGGPKDLILATAPQDATVVTTIEVPINKKLNPGLYWLAYTCQNGTPATIRSYSSHINTYIARSTNPFGNQYSYYLQSANVAALEAVAGAYDSAGNTNSPQILLKVA